MDFGSASFMKMLLNLSRFPESHNPVVIPEEAQKLNKAFAPFLYVIIFQIKAIAVFVKAILIPLKMLILKC